MDGDGKKDTKTLMDEFQDAANEGYPSLPPFEPRKYLSYLDEFNISEKEKTELLKNLWFIMATFAQIGYGVDSVQYAIPALAQFVSEEKNIASPAADDVESIETATDSKKRGPS